MSNLSQALEEVSALFSEPFKEKRDIILKGFEQAYKGVLAGKVRESHDFNLTHANHYIGFSKEIAKFEYFGFGLGYIIAVMENKPREFLADSSNNSTLILAIQNVDIISTYAQQAGYNQNRTLGPQIGNALQEYMRKHARKWHEALQSVSNQFSKEERKGFQEIEARLRGIL